MSNAADEAPDFWMSSGMEGWLVTKRSGRPDMETDLRGLSYDHEPLGASWEVELSNGTILHIESDFVGQDADPVDFGSLVSTGETGLIRTVAELDARHYRGSFSSDVALNPAWTGSGSRFITQSELQRWEVLLSEGVALTIAADSVVVDRGYLRFGIALHGVSGHWSETIARVPVAQVTVIESQFRHLEPLFTESG